MYILSTNVSRMSTTTVKRQNKEGHVENVTCPFSIQLYNSYMGGVDRADQLCGYYRVRMKSHKFYRFVLLNLLGFILFHIFFSITDNLVSLHKFTSAPVKRRNECDTPDGTAPTLEGHFPIKGSTGHCCYCWNVKGRRHDYCVRCRRCGKALCIVNWDSPAEGPNCFEHCHTERLELMATL